MTTIYTIRFQFQNAITGFAEVKEFDFTSKDVEVDFFDALNKTDGVEIVSRFETKAYGTGEFLVAVNDFETARVRGLE